MWQSHIYKEICFTDFNELKHGSADVPLCKEINTSQNISQHFIK